MTQSMFTNRIDIYDQMKGIAILLVVIGHIMQFSFGMKHSTLVDMLGIFHMPLFFYVAGFFSYKKYNSFSEIICKLAKRSFSLLVPFIIFASLWCYFSGESLINLMLGGGGRYWFLWVLTIISSFFLIYLKSAE